MKWDDHKAWILPLLASLVIGLIIAVFTTVYSAWYNHHTVHHVIAWDGVMGILRTPIPLWFGLSGFILCAIAALIRIPSYKSQGLVFNKSGNPTLVHRGAKLGLTAPTEQTLLTVKAKDEKPKLHVAWHGVQTTWTFVGLLPERTMEIGGLAYWTLENSNERLLIVGATINRVSVKMAPVSINPGGPVAERIWFSASPSLGQEGLPFEAKIVLKDHKGRDYQLDSHSFSFVQPAKPLSNTIAIPSSLPAAIPGHKLK